MKVRYSTFSARLKLYAHDPSLWVGYVVRIVEQHFVENFGRKHIRNPLPERMKRNVRTTLKVCRD